MIITILIRALNRNENDRVSPSSKDQFVFRNFGERYSTKRSTTWQSKQLRTENDRASPRQRINLSSEAQQVKQVWSTGPVNVLLNFFATQLFDGLATSPIRCQTFWSISYLMNSLVRQSVNQSVNQSVRWLAG